MTMMTRAGPCHPTTRDVGTGSSEFYSDWATPGEAVPQTHKRMLTRARAHTHKTLIHTNVFFKNLKMGLVTQACNSRT